MHLADLTSHDTFLEGLPHQTFAWLREHDPVHWVDEHDGAGFWAVTRHADVRTVGRDPATFSSAAGIRLEEMAPDELEGRRTLMEHDPPDHTRLRRLVQEAFSRPVVARYEDELRRLAVEVVEEAVARSEFDFVTEVARPLPIAMLCRLLGVPDSDIDHLVTLADEMVSNTDPEFTRLVVDMSDTGDYRLLPFRSPAAVEVFDYAQELADSRRRRPGEDLITTLVSATLSGRPLTDLEFKNFFALLLVAGNETTRHSISQGMLAFIDNPAQRRRWVEDVSVRRTGTEEILRWASVTIHFRRTATCDTELSGRDVAAGDKVVMWYPSANRDEREFTEPLRFDLGRDPNRHVTFGHGPHMCVGAWLARLEIRVLFEELLPRLADIEVSGPLVRLRSNFHHGINHLPVRVRLK
ncbi:cytochrome P450 [soil metagenome]